MTEKGLMKVVYDTDCDYKKPGATIDVAGTKKSEAWRPEICMNGVQGVL